MWPFSKRETTQMNQLLSVSVNDEGVSFALALLTPMADSSSKISFAITNAEFIPCKEASQWEQVLNKFVLNHHLKGTPCCFVLDPKDYYLFSLDAPIVQPDELKQSAKFLIKDLIDYSLDDVVVDVFQAPVREGQKSKVFITAARKSYLEMMFNIFDMAGLELKKIDIMECAVRNLAVLSDGEENGIVVLYKSSESLHIIIIKEDVIYLIRRVDNFYKRLNVDIKPEEPVEIKKSEEPSEPPKESGFLGKAESEITFISPTSTPSPPNKNPDQASMQFTQEVIRSIDYYKRQLAQNAPIKILFDSSLWEKQDFVNYLHEQTQLLVEMLPIEKIFAFQEGLTTVVREKCLSVIGGSFFIQEWQEGALK